MSLVVFLFFSFIQWKDQIKQWYSSFLHATDLHCCPEAIKNTSVSRTVARTDIFLHYDKHGCCGLLWGHPTSYSAVHQKCIYPQLKIVPHKCTIYFEKFAKKKLQCPAVFANYLAFLGDETTDLGQFLNYLCQNMCSVGTNVLGEGRVGKSESIEAHGVFMGFVDKKSNRITPA